MNLTRLYINIFNSFLSMKKQCLKFLFLYVKYFKYNQQYKTERVLYISCTL